MTNEEMILAILEKHGEMLERHNEVLERIIGRLDKIEATQAQQGGQLARLESNQSEMQTTLTRVAVTQEGVVLPRIQVALEGHDELKRKIDTLATKEQVEELADDVDVIKAVVSQHSGDISKLKKAQ